MKHKMYDRILYNAYVKVNSGLDSMYDAWGYGCPVTVNTTVIKYNHDEEERKAFIRSRVTEPFSLEKYLYSDYENYEKFLADKRKCPYFNFKIK